MKTRGEKRMIMKNRKRWKQGIAFVLSTVLTLGAVPILSKDVKVQAADSYRGTVTAYATKDELMNDYIPDQKGDQNKLDWVLWGKDKDGDPEKWYILGRDSGISGDNIAILAATPILSDRMFQNDANNRTYSYPAGTGYGSKAGSIEVYANHYGASSLRASLRALAEDDSYFSKAEQKRMNATMVKTIDRKNGAEYSITDKLYLPTVDDETDKSHSDKVKVGNSDDIKFSISNYTYEMKIDRMCWLRDILVKGNSYYIHVLGQDSEGGKIPNSTGDVYPAANLSLSNVLFASAAHAASTDQEDTGKMFDDTVKERAVRAHSQGDECERKPWVSRAMTLRFDGKDKKIGDAAYEKETGLIFAKKDPSATGTVSLVVQGNDSGLDWYYSKKIDGVETISVSDMKSVLLKKLNINPHSDFNVSLETIDLSFCRIWLEATDSDGLAYAVNATEKPMLTVSYYDGDTQKQAYANYDPAQSITGLKEEIADKTGIAAADQQLVFEDKVLTEADTQGNQADLEDYGIQKGSTITLNQRIPQVDVSIYLPQGEQALRTEADCQTKGIAHAALAWTDTMNNPIRGNANYYPWCYKAHMILTPKMGYYLTYDTDVRINDGSVEEKALDADGTLIAANSYASNQAKLIAVTAPQSVSGVANGTERTAEALGLPKTVTIETESEHITTAEVNWNLTDLVSGSYDPDVRTEQNFTVKGTITLPEEVANTDQLPLEVTINVIVQAADITGVPAANPAAGIYAENQRISLSSSTADAVIYYTTDGTIPEVIDGKPAANTVRYTEPIAVEGIAGQSVDTTIQAIAVRDGLADSPVAAFHYTIRIPANRYVIRAAAGTGGSISPDGTVTVTEGENQTFTVTADEGYELAALTVDGKEEAPAKEYTFTNVVGDHTIEAAFKQITSPDPTPEPKPEPEPAPEPDPIPEPETKPEPEQTSYKIIDGADSQWIKDSDGNLSIRGNGDFAKFVGVRVDGKALDRKNYTVKEGSTIITLKADYLDTLSEGKHTFEMVWSDGTAGTTFTVAKSEPDDFKKEKDKSSDNPENGKEQNAQVSGNGGNNGSTTGADKDKKDHTGTGTIGATLQTGDTSRADLWFIVLCISGAGLLCLVVKQKKQKENEYK